MKVRVMFCLALLCFFCSVFAQSTQDEKAIIALVNKAYQALLDRDWETYTDTWAHEKTASRIGISGEDVSELNGWENIEEMYLTGLKNNPEPGKTVFEYRNFTILVKDDIAWAAFDKYLKVENEMEKRTREYRRLIKQEGVWKVLTLMHVSQREAEE